MMSENRPKILQRDQKSGLVRLRTIVILRWLAAAGQTTAVLIANYVLDLEFELGWCFLAIGALAITNLVATFVFPENRRLPERDVFMAMLFDLLQLSFLLFLTGGLNNPFVLLMLAPVTVSAMTLSPKSTYILSALAVVMATSLVFFHLPLQTVGGLILQMPHVLSLGFWVAMMIGIGFMVTYALRVTTEAQAMSEALLAAQMALAREQKLTDLGGVVAAAAHELGTPLATIKLASSELYDELEGQKELQEDAALIREQADRCTGIMRSMGRIGKDDLHLRHAPLSAVIEEAAEPHIERGIDVQFDHRAMPEFEGAMPHITRSPEIVHGLRNLVQNAVDFATGAVVVKSRWDENTISIRVEDDGPGFPPDIIGRIGDPFIGRRRSSERDSNRPEYEGMGLGLFIAKTLLERAGAEVLFANAPATKKPGSGGAVAEVTWKNTASIRQNTAGRNRLGENRQIEA